MTAEQQAIMGAAYTVQNKEAIEKGLMPPIPGINQLLESGNTSGQTTTPAKAPAAPPLPPGAARQYVPQ